MLLVALSQERKSGPSPARSSAPSAELRELEAIPEQAPLLVTINLRAPRAEVLRSLLFDAELPGLGRVSEICGYDPTKGISSLALALFRSEGASSPPAFGIVASGRFEQSKLAACAEQLVRSRGGHPERQQAGSMVLVRDDRKPGAEIALLQNNLVAVSARKHLRQMLQALDGKIPSVVDNPTHRALRGALGADAPVLASLELEAGWLERLFEDEPVDKSPLATRRAGAVRLSVEEDIEVAALLRCRDADGCRRLQAFLVDFTKRALPLVGPPWSSALSNVNLKLEARELRASWTIDPALLSRLLRDMTRDPSPGADSPAPPDETIPARP